MEDVFGVYTIRIGDVTGCKTPGLRRGPEVGEYGGRLLCIKIRDITKICASTGATLPPLPLPLPLPDHIPATAYPSKHHCQMNMFVNLPARSPRDP